MDAGYSGTPLPQKLGIKPGHRVALLGAPDGFEPLLDPLPDGVDLLSRAAKKMDLVLAFVTTYAELARKVPPLGDAIRPAGSLWIAWPKRASGVPTDITEDSIREVALPLGLVDNKVCAVTDVWSGLRLVWRKELR